MCNYIVLELCVRTWEGVGVGVGVGGIVSEDRQVCGGIGGVVTAAV